MKSVQCRIPVIFLSSSTSYLFLIIFNSNDFKCSYLGVEV
jgi:hypothetical protein